MLLPRVHLAMPGDWGCYWHFEGGSQGGLPLNILQCIGQLSTTGNYLVPNVRCQIWDQRLCRSRAWWQTVPPTRTCSSFAAHCTPGTVSRASHTSSLFRPAYRLKSLNINKACYWTLQRAEWQNRDLNLSLYGSKTLSMSLLSPVLQ